MRNKTLGVFSLVMINIIAVDSIRTLPMAASFGFSLIGLYCITALTFFIPTALITAELATAWPEKGGLYAWVKIAFGHKWGLCAVYLQWIYNIVWYPTILSLIASTLAHLFAPEWVHNPAFMVSTVLITFWGCTLLNVFGMRLSSRVSIFGSLVGTLAPMLIIIALGIVWLLNGQPSHITPSWKTVFPPLTNLASLVFFSQIVYSLLGLEMSSVHVLEVRNPQRDYPRALLFSSIAILLSLSLSALAIAVIVPPGELTNLTGIMQAFSLFGSAFGLKWLEPFMAGAILIGGICAVATWIIGPTKGLFAASSDGLLPPALAKTNRFGVPYILLLLQALISSLLTLVYLLLPSIEGAYFALSSLAAQLSLMMYLILFAAAIRLRYSHPHVPRPFKIPGKNNTGIWLVGGAGWLLSLFIVLLGFVPPQEQIQIGSLIRYEGFLVGGMIVLLMPFLWIHTPRLKKAF